MIDFMGKQLTNPLIASSCIATESVSNVLNLVDNGIQGVILKSCADYQRKDTNGKRQFAVDSLGYTYASSPFEKEILTLDECINMMLELRKKTDILLIPSFTATNLNPNEWIEACHKLEKSGADAIQLDFFYMGNLIGTNELSNKIVSLLQNIISSIDIPIMPKLNINLPKDYIMPLLKKSGIEYVSLLDSVRSPYIESSNDKYYISKRLDAETTSCFGSWQLPLTISYTYTAIKNGLKVCAGGGITNIQDFKKLLDIGATTVQSATLITKCPNVKEIISKL